MSVVVFVKVGSASGTLPSKSVGSVVVVFVHVVFGYLLCDRSVSSKLSLLVVFVSCVCVVLHLWNKASARVLPAGLVRGRC